MRSKLLHRLEVVRSAFFWLVIAIYSSIVMAATPTDAVLTESECPSVSLEFEQQLPNIQQTYGTCFAEATTQALDYHRLANGARFTPATFETLGPIYASTISGKPYGGSNFMTSSILLTISNLIESDGLTDISALDEGGSPLDILHRMAKEKGCIATPFDLMPSADRRILVNEILLKTKLINQMASLPIEKRWDFFVENFSSEAWMGSMFGKGISRESVEGVDGSVRFISQLKMMKIAFEKMVCPVRTISYPAFEINRLNVRSYTEVVKWLSKNLAINKRPIIISFCSAPIDVSKFTYNGRDSEPRYSDSKGCGRHVALVTGMYFDKVCRFKIRNWWGASYPYHSTYRPDGQGNLFMYDYQLESNVYWASQILDKK